MEREAREARGRASIASKARAERAARTARAGARRQGAAARREWREPPEDGDSKPVRSLMPLRGRYAAPPGGLSWERLGRLALQCKFFGNPYKIAPGSLPGPPGGHFGAPGAHFGPPGQILALLGLILGRLGLTLGLLGRSWGSPGAPGALPGASGEPLGASKIAPGGPPGGLPRRSSILVSFWGPFWLHF